ncbi:MAG: Na+/H+ antiporter NhaC-like protein [Clostridia bacterium]|nr:Na+/H+ antiporter NhaC-like protein [Clostridia bacterium]
MDIAAALIFIFFSLLFSVYRNINIVYPLFLGLMLLMAIAVRRGFKLSDVLNMTLKGSKKSLMIIRIFLLIGAITAVWRASGTVAFIVYHGIELMNPKYFIVYAFVLSAIVSFLLGTAFGTVGTIGIVMMILAKSGNVDINIAAGAIIAGAYFGDRGSPMSSSAVLTASITETDLYTNVKNMFKTALVPLILSIVIYFILSLYNPLVFTDNNILSTISANFNIHLAAILPAAAILALAAFRVDVKISMLTSILIGILLAVVLQGYTIPDILQYTVFGFSLEGADIFNDIIKGGGILSMVKIALIVLISSAYSGIFEGTQMLKEIQRVLDIIADRYGIFVATIISSLITASLGCTQALAILLTNQLIKDTYMKQKRDKYELAVDIENSAVVLAPLIPWNIGGAVPAAALTANIGFVPYAFYLYLIPIYHLIVKKLKEK